MIAAEKKARRVRLRKVIKTAGMTSSLLKTTHDKQQSQALSSFLVRFETENHGFHTESGGFCTKTDEFDTETTILMDFILNTTIFMLS